ncbi:hypothetical protein [Yoonia sp. SS1-5]|uniref:Cytochrome b561 bacterial/Ni-hydrogenase domain-containing protein n=2 Tax=Yoonia rhodophyticola TaxID=3137370 RepID=A0AAN0M7E5_9RHOB
MQLAEILAALSSDPEQMTRGILRIFHFIGLALGLGAATLLDLMTLRFFWGRVMTQRDYDIFAFLSGFVAVGLKLLWVTGLGFLAFYWAFEPVKLGNEKVWAKMLIVAILTINGVFIHRTIIPFIYRQIGEPMLQGISRRKRHAFVTAGIVSFVSWYAPLVIANLPHLNFQVPMIQILEVYGLVLLAVMIVAHLVLVGSDMTIRFSGRTRQALQKT